MKISSDLGHWLAGFTDGEGCFRIGLTRRSYQCHFTIQLRDDDEPLLRWISGYLGLGAVSHGPARGRNAPLASWRVSAISHCLALVQIFDQYPLRAKKARDYAVWREAVIEKARGLGHSSNGRLRILKAELEEGRNYRAVPRARTAEPQLRLIAADGGMR